MAEILSAKCTVCGKVFEGKDCVEKAEEHEKIPIEEFKYEIGDILVNIHPEDGYINLNIIHNVFPSNIEHRTMYNGTYDFDNHFKIHKQQIGEINTIDRFDLLNGSQYQDLRDEIIEIQIDIILKKLLRTKERFGIDKIFNYESEE